MANVLIQVTRHVETESRVRVTAIEGISRLLLSGRSSAALLVSLVLFILALDAEKRDNAKFKRIVHILMMSTQVHAIFDEAYKKCLQALLLEERSFFRSEENAIEMDKAIAYFAKMSNPDAVEQGAIKE